MSTDDPFGPGDGLAPRAPEAEPGPFSDEGLPPLPPLLPPPPVEAQPLWRRRWLRVTALTVVLLAAAFFVYRYLGERQYQSALAAHRRGDCRAALDGYSRVTELYRYASSESAEAARRGTAECRMFLTATGTRPGEFATAANRYRAFVERYPNSPLVPRARQRLAGTYADWGDQLVGEEDYSGGVAQYVTATTEFPGTAGAARAEHGLSALLDRAADQADTGKACEAVDILLALSEGEAEAKEARRTLPSAYLRCARNEFEKNQDTMALDDLNALIDDFPRHSLVPKAKALRVDVRVDIIGGTDTVKLDQPQRLGSAGSGEVVLEIQNSSPHRLEILLSGPDSRSVIVGKCSSCRTYSERNTPDFCPEVGPTAKIRLGPGTYKVVFHDPDTVTTQDAFGTWRLSGGDRYGNCNLLVNR